MGWRFRRSVRFGPVRLNITGKGLSSVSLGGRGATINMPVARAGGVRATVGIPGSGISYSAQAPAQRRPARVPTTYRREHLSLVPPPPALPVSNPWPMGKLLRVFGIGVAAVVVGAAVVGSGLPQPAPTPAQREQQYQEWAKANGVEDVELPAASTVEPAPAPAPAPAQDTGGLYRGEKGGCFTYSGSGRRRYVARSECSAAGI